MKKLSLLLIFILAASLSSGCFLPPMPDPPIDNDTSADDSSTEYRETEAQQKNDPEYGPLSVSSGDVTVNPEEFFSYTNEFKDGQLLMAADGSGIPESNRTQ